MNLLLPIIRARYSLVIIIGLGLLLIIGVPLPFGMTATLQPSHALPMQSELLSRNSELKPAANGPLADNQPFSAVQRRPNQLALVALGSYDIGNVNHYTPFALSLSGLDPAYPATNSNRSFYQFYTVAGSGQFVADSDGTAHITQRVVNGNGDGFTLDLAYGGWHKSLPSGQKPICLTLECPDQTDWNYYTELSGTLTGLPDTRYAGALFLLRNDAQSSAQIGTNAQLYAPHGQLGGAARLILELVQPPSTGIVLQSHLSDLFYHFTLNRVAVDHRLAQTSTKIEFSNVSQRTCRFYPFGLGQHTLTGINEGDRLPQLPIGATDDDLVWLAWQIRSDASAFVDSLIPPGTSDIYLNPDDQYDQALSISDWVVEYVPPQVDSGGLSASIDEALTILAPQPFEIPIWDRVRTRMGKNFYRIVGFATVRLLDHYLVTKSIPGGTTKQPYVSLQFDGYAFHCNPTAPSTVTTSIELIEQTNNRWTYQVIGGGASQWNLGIADCVAFVDSLDPAENAQIGIDATTGMIGLRWQLDDAFRHGQFTVTFDRPLASGAINVLVRHDSLTRIAKVRGPSCHP